MLIDWLLARQPDALVVLLLALAVDAVVGDPKWLYRAVPHPVELLGRMIDAAERRLNDPTAARTVRLRQGALLVAAIALASFATGLCMELALGGLPGGWIAEAVLAGTLFAFRGLFDHVRLVAAELESGLKQGRAAVSHIVGRDPESLELSVARGLVPPGREQESFIPDRRMLGGSAAEIVDELGRYGDAGVGMVLVQISLLAPLVPDALEWVASEVLAQLR
jgi:hypothetical protein